MTTPRATMLVALVLMLPFTSVVLAQDYPSCIGLSLATNFFFEGDVTSTASCVEACATLFQTNDGVVYDSSAPLVNGTLVSYCECGEDGRLCQDAAVASGGNEEMATTTGAPPAQDTTQANSSPSPTESVSPGGEEPPTSAPPPPTSSAMTTTRGSVLSLLLLIVGLLTTLVLV